MILPKEQQVTSLEMSKKLYEVLGKLDSLDCWALVGGSYVILPKQFVEDKALMIIYYSAYTVSELLQILLDMGEPDTITHIFTYGVPDKSFAFFPDILARHIIESKRGEK